MIAFRQAELDKMIAQEAGSFDESNESNVGKALQRRLRKTRTALKAAGIMVNGTDVRSSIAVKIEGTLRRLASQKQAQENAEEQIAKLPFDVERLVALIDSVEASDIVDFPTDLTRLGDEDERTDEEHEAAFIANEEDAGEEN